jgi:hypothetical protein
VADEGGHRERHDKKDDPRDEPAKVRGVGEGAGG